MRKRLSCKSCGIALLVLFFLAGMVKERGSFAEVKRPEQAVKVFFEDLLSLYESKKEKEDHV